MILSLERWQDGNASAEAVNSFDPKKRPVDLVHLSRYTMGNEVVEKQVLELFRRQTRLYFERLTKAGHLAAWKDAIGVLKASAQSVGSWQLLDACEQAEKVEMTVFSSARMDFQQAIAHQIEKANQFIDEIL